MKYQGVRMTAEGFGQESDKQIKRVLRRQFGMEKYFKMLKENGADLAIKIATDTIVTAAWTVYRCKYGCDNHFGLILVE